VSGHIPNLLDTWGLSTISLGKSASRNEIQREEIRMGWDNKFFRIVKLCMGRKRERNRA
jgi:hypothetical protein